MADLVGVKVLGGTKAEVVAELKEVHCSLDAWSMDK